MVAINKCGKNLLFEVFDKQNKQTGFFEYTEDLSLVFQDLV